MSDDTDVVVKRLARIAGCDPNCVGLEMCGVCHATVKSEAAALIASLSARLAEAERERDELKQHVAILEEEITEERRNNGQFGVGA